MDAGDVITLVGVVVAVGAAAVAIWQARVAQGSAISARDAADAAVEQVKLARRQQTNEHVHRARAVHDDAHAALADAVQALDPEPVHMAGRLRSRSVLEKAAPHIDEVERHARRLADIGATPVANSYMAAHLAATRVRDYVDDNVGYSGSGPISKIPAFADGFESLMRQLNRDREAAEKRWTEWRGEREMGE